MEKYINLHFTIVIFFHKNIFDLIYIKIIFEQWKRDAIRPNSKTRGVEQEDPPSIKTLRRWFKRYIKIVGQGTRPTKSPTQYLYLDQLLQVLV